MATSISPQMNFTATDTYSIDAADDATVAQNGFNLSNVRLNATSTPAVTKSCYKEYALVAGALTIDLTALTDAFGAALDGTGLKVQTVIIVNPAGNASINIAPGASNPYPLLGAANDITIPAHASVDTHISMFLPEGCPDVSGTVKTLDITGTGTQTFKLGLTLG